MSPNYRRTVIALAERALSDFGGTDLSRETATALLALWPCRDLLDADLSAEVLSRFPAAEPPAMPGMDWLPADLVETAERDGNLLVAEAVQP